MAAETESRPKIEVVASSKKGGEFAALITYPARSEEINLGKPEGVMGRITFERLSWGAVYGILAAPSAALLFEGASRFFQPRSTDYITGTIEMTIGLAEALGALAWGTHVLIKASINKGKA